MKKNILILDDMPEICEIISSIIEKNWGNFCEIHCAYDYDKAMDISQKILIDIFILDIELGNSRSGLLFAEHIRDIVQYETTPIIFETADALSIQSVVNKIHCYGYITKIFELKKIIELLSPLMQVCPKDSIYICDENIKINFDKKNFYLDDSEYEVKISNDVSKTIKLKDIIYVESIQRSIIIHTTKEKYSTKYLTLKKFMNQNKDKYFLRCHNSYIINKNYFYTYDNALKIIFLNHSEQQFKISVGRHYVESVKIYTVEKYKIKRLNRW